MHASMCTVVDSGRDDGPPFLIYGYVTRMRPRTKSLARNIYSCFEKGCPTKPYATMPKGIMDNADLRYLIEAFGVLVT